MWRSILICVGLLSACGSGGTGAPEQVLFERDRITVVLSDGWPCVGFRTPDTLTETGWSGQLEGCPVTYPYTVHLQDGQRPRHLELVLSGNGAGPKVVIDAGPGRSLVFGAP